MIACEFYLVGGPEYIVIVYWLSIYPSPFVAISLLANPYSQFTQSRYWNTQAHDIINNLSEKSNHVRICENLSVSR